MGISPADISAVINDDSSYYVCKVCIPTAPPDQLKTLAEESIHKRVFSPSPDVGPVAPVNAPVTMDMLKTMMCELTKAMTNTMMETMNEMMEKREKRRNLVIVGLPETKALDKEQNQDDMQRIGKYCDALKIDRSSVRKTFRDGQRRPGGRIVKVLFDEGCSGDRLTFLKMGRSVMLRDPDIDQLPRKPFVRPDLTFRERQADHALREELKTRKDAGEDVVIRRGEIVPRTSGSVN
jgi:hypothetical protein